MLVPSGAFRMGGFEGKLRSRSPSQWASEYPWEGKARKAYFRGTPYCGVHKFGRCSRCERGRVALTLSTLAMTAHSPGPMLRRRAGT